MQKIKLAMLISGGGSTMEAIINSCKDGELSDFDISPVLVISSKADAPGIQKAKALGIKDEDIIVINPKDFLM